MLVCDNFTTLTAKTSVILETEPTSSVMLAENAGCETMVSVFLIDSPHLERWTQGA